MVNIYYWDAPIAADNLAQGPEREHMVRMYAALAQAAAEILDSPAQVRSAVNLTSYAIGRNSGPQEGKAAAYVCGKAVFIENPDGVHDRVVTYNGVNYTVARGSSTLLLNDKVIFNTADVHGSGAVRTWTPAPGFSMWRSWQDTVIPASPAAIPAPSPPYTPWTKSALGRVVRAIAPLEAVNFTEYDSELMVYSVELTAADIEAATAAAASVTNLTLKSASAQAWTAFVNGNMVGTGWELSHSGRATTISVPIATEDFRMSADGTALLTLLSTSLGIDNGGGVKNNGSFFSSTGVKGITSTAPGSVMFGTVDLTEREWTHVAGADGETKNVSGSGGDSVTWTSLSGVTTKPMTWLTATFDTPAEVLQKDAVGEMNATLNVDVLGLGRGRFFVNGMDLGRYWSQVCGSNLCQRYYPIPFDILKAPPAANTITFLDELGVTNVTAAGLAVSRNSFPQPCGPPKPTGQPVTMANCGSAETMSLNHGGNGLSTVSPGSSPKLCLDSAASPAGTTAWEPCSPTKASQLWSVSNEGPVQQATTRDDTVCLDITNQNATVGAPVGTWHCNDGANQAWNTVNGQFVSRMNGLCLGWAC